MLKEEEEEERRPRLMGEGDFLHPPRFTAPSMFSPSSRQASGCGEPVNFREGKFGGGEEEEKQIGPFVPPSEQICWKSRVGQKLT